MTTNNSSYGVPIQHPQHSNFVQNAQVCITYICDVPLLSYISMQTLGGYDHELWPNEQLSGIDSASPYPAVNHADVSPPTRYTSTMGNEDPPHVAIVSIQFFSVFMLPLLTVAVPKGLGQHRGNQSQLDADHPTPGITQYIPIDPGPPPLEQFAPVIPVRVVSLTPLPSKFMYSLSYCASNCRRCPTTAPPVTYLFLTMYQDLLEGIRAWYIPERQSPKISKRISRVTISTTLAHVSTTFARGGADQVVLRC
jgi:hypothetical protein